MPVLLENIPSQKFEIIRDRIGEILSDELYAKAYQGDDTLECEIFIERSAPVGQEETAVIIVSLASGNYDNQDIKQADGSYTYNIDVFTSSPANEDKEGDTLSAIAMQRLIGACRWILMHPLYIRLGYTPPFNCTRTVQEFQIAVIQRQDSCNVSQGRLQFVVKVPETVEFQEPVIADQFITTVKLSNSEKGFKFITIQPEV